MNTGSAEEVCRVRIDIPFIVIPRSTSVQDFAEIVGEHDDRFPVLISMFYAPTGLPAVHAPRSTGIAFDPGLCDEFLDQYIELHDDSFFPV